MKTLRTFYLRVLFRLVFKKVHHSGYNRCFACHANGFCDKIKVCTCGAKQQYRMVFNLPHIFTT